MFDLLRLSKRAETTRPNLELAGKVYLLGWVTLIYMQT